MSTNSLGLYDSPSLDIFRQMASNITTEHIEDISKQIHTGGTPTFEELFEKIKVLNNKLTLKAVELAGNFSHEVEQQSSDFTIGCQKIIKKSNDDVLNVVKISLMEKAKREANIKK